MSISTLPTFEDPFYSYITTLEGKPYLLSMRYNQRESCWYLSLAESDGNKIISGIKVVANVDLFWRHSDARMPPGRLFAMTTGNNQVHPGQEDFAEDERVKLVYVSSDEVL